MRAASSTWLTSARALAMCLVLFVPLGGCATITGFATGALTGFVDLPTTVYKTSKHQHDDPDFYMASVFLAPIGMVLGPFNGLVKGFAVDIGWLSGDVKYSDAFLSLEKPSVWRPYQWGWMNDK